MNFREILCSYLSPYLSLYLLKIVYFFLENIPSFLPSLLTDYQKDSRCSLSPQRKSPKRILNDGKEYECSTSDRDLKKRITFCIARTVEECAC